MSNRTEAARSGAKCTCTRDHDAQTSSVDPECPFHGGDFGREDLAQVDSATGEDTGDAAPEVVPE